MDCKMVIRPLSLSKESAQGVQAAGQDCLAESHTGEGVQIMHAGMDVDF
jgi:hypothetical protein